MSNTDKFVSLTGLSRVLNSIKQMFNTKQDKLTSGTNIKTINGNAVLGSGNIDVVGKIDIIDTNESLDDVNVSYATTAYVDNKFANIDLTDYATTNYVDGLIGDINSVLESIISGGGTSIFPIDLHVGDNGDVGISLYNHIVQHHDSGYCAFEENEIVTYNNTKITYFNYNGLDCTNYISGTNQLVLSSNGVVALNEISGGSGN